MITIKYFAWVRERIGKAEEALELPAGVVTVADLAHHLAGLGDEYAYAFENPGIVRAALDKRHVSPDTAIANSREVAFFPPMTGG